MAGLASTANPCRMKLALAHFQKPAYLQENGALPGSLAATLFVRSKRVWSKNP
jgi:hypothetical protein